MSLTDRNRTHSAPAAYQPSAPTGPAPTGPAPGRPKPYRHLVLLAVGLIVLALVLAIIAYSLTRPTASGDPGTGPSVAIPSAVQTPTPTPTLSERDQLALAASNGYMAYIAAYDKAPRGADKLPPAMAATVTGPQVKTVLTELKDAKAGGFERSGSAVAYTRVDALGELSDKVPSAKLATCVDQTDVTVTKNGEPFAGRPGYLRGQYTMHKVGSTWKVYSGTNEVWKGGDCLAALGPTAR